MIGLLLVGALWYFYLRPSHSLNNGLQHEEATAQTGQSAPSGGGRGGHRGGGAAGLVPVVAGVVQKKDVPIFLDGIGTVQAYNTVTVHPQVGGTLTTVSFQEGQDVKKGDLLAIIDPRPYQAQLDGAVAKKNQDIAQLNNAKVLLDRDTDLYKKGVLDHQSFDTQRFLMDQLDATVKADQAAIDNAQTQLSYTQITAPFDARVGIRQVDEGNVVNTGSTLVVLTQLKPISVIFTLPQQNLNEINRASSQGALKVIAMDSTLSKPLENGSLAVVDNQIDTTTGTIKLKANFPNEDLKLWPGQFVNTRLLVSTQKGGLVVPASVVQRGPNGAFAYVITPGNTAEMRPVEVAQIDGGQALIASGLQEGERVVVDGQYKLQPGAPVQIQNAAKATDGRPLAQNDRVPDPDQSGQPAGATKGQMQSQPPNPAGQLPPEGASQGQAAPASPSDQNPRAAQHLGQHRGGTGHHGSGPEGQPSGGKVPPFSEGGPATGEEQGK